MFFSFHSLAPLSPWKRRVKVNEKWYEQREEEEEEEEEEERKNSVGTVQSVMLIFESGI